MFTLDIKKVNTEDFTVKRIILFDEDCFLIYPKNFNIKWTINNSCFRSSIYRVFDGKPRSLSWKKFTNIDEQPEFDPIDFSKSIEYIQKVDGTGAIISKINGNICFRTRRTYDARILEKSGHEVDFLIKKYPLLFNNDYINSENFTILCEWTSNKNIICLKESDDPTLWLTGIVKHENYEYLPQFILDELSNEWKINRPKRYIFDNFTFAVDFIENRQDIEGLVLYCNNNQVLKKCKSTYYLNIHALKSKFDNIDNLIDLFCSLDYPDYQFFYNNIQETVDYETAQESRSKISQIIDAYKQVIDIICGMVHFLEKRNSLSRKDLAAEIFNSYGKNSNKAGFLFILKDKGSLDKNSIKKLLYQILKK